MDHDSHIIEGYSAILGTISEDRTTGSSSHEEANLKSLDHGGGAFSLKTDSVDAPAVRGGNHALQDYQTQFMLLQQQNKKRLMMARLEQDKVGRSTGTKPPEPVPLFNESNGGRSRSIQKEEEMAHFEQPSEDEGNTESILGNSENRKTRPQAKPKATRKRRSTLPQSSASACSEPPAKKRAARHGDSVWNDDSDPTTIESYALACPGPVPPTSQAHIPTLHRIVCGRPDHSIYHSTNLFADVPQRLPNTSRHRGHFSGAKPVYDVDEFLSRCGGFGFLVFKDYQCATNHNIASHNTQDKFASDSISIVSDELQELISKIAECPLVRFNRRTSTQSQYNETRAQLVANEFEIPSPYNFFYHHRTKLLEESYSCTLSNIPSTNNSAITALLEYLEDDQGDVFREADELFEHGQITVQHLQRLFRPNEVVIARHGNVYSAYVLADWPSINEDSSWHLSCWSWGYDGSFFHRKDTNLTLNYRLGEVTKIANLGVFPLRFCSDDLKNNLIERGKRFWDLRHKHYVSYNGWDFQKEEFYSSARCMIDYQTYRKFHQHAVAFTFSKATKHPFDQRRDYFSESDFLQDEDYILMPPQIHGFVLKEKKWVCLGVDQVTPVQWNKDAFQRLVIPPKTKDLVKALVSVRTTERGNQQGMSLTDTRDDLIAGKGNGLIMLLHGGPGTGKTLTAESVAEIAEMPLYSVTCGDIGTTPEGVEKYLKTILYLGKTWNCVLLLDEADVFLEERTLQDLERNSLVSVFLRVLEYYEGILILTSNRVGIFDEAFKSRIQVALHYQPLTVTSRRKIWQNFLDMLQNDKGDVDFQDLSNHLEELADREMNGREIRNAMTTAKQIALYKKETLCWDHIELTINTARDFTRYLGTLHGHTEEQWAREKRER